MANNYLQFSEVIDHLTHDEIAWLEAQLQPIAVIDAEAYSLDQVPGHLDAEKATYRGPRFLKHAKDIHVWGDDVDFNHAFLVEQCNGHHNHRLWIYAEEHGSVDQAAELVRMFLRKFRPDDIWTLTYAATCSKPRVGEFSGGVLIVTAKHVRWHDCGAIAARALKSHERRHQRQAA